MKKHRIPLPVMLTLLVFGVSILTILLIGLGMGVLMHFRLIQMERLALMPLFSLLTVSLSISLVVTMLFSRHSLRQVQELMDAFDQVSSGDYSARVSTEEGPKAIQELCVKFNHMAQELGSVELLRRDFISSFSHEFKTPIVSIRGFARALKWESLTDAEREEYLNIIISESDRLTSLATNVLALSRVENQTILTDTTSFNLAEQLRQVVVLLDERWSARNLAIDFEAEEVQLKGNQDMLNQVWINILDNAIKFSPEGGTLTIRLTRQGTQAQVTVADEGPGMDAGTQAHIFERFYQGDASHATKGNGLGLAIAQRIVILHAGDIRCDSEPGKGAVFIVRLPGAEDEV